MEIETVICGAFVSEPHRYDWRMPRLDSKSLYIKEISVRFDDGTLGTPGTRIFGLSADA
jgi:hypothetical protein